MKAVHHRNGFFRIMAECTHHLFCLVTVEFCDRFPTEHFETTLFFGEHFIFALLFGCLKPDKYRRVNFRIQVPHAYIIHRYGVPPQRLHMYQLKLLAQNSQKYHGLELMTRLFQVADGQQIGF